MYSKEEARILKQEFWEGFDRYTKFYAKKINEPIQWILYKTGIKGLELKFFIDRKLIQVILEVNSKSEDRRFEIYTELLKYKVIIEEGFSGELVWEHDFVKEEGNIVSRLRIDNTLYNYHDRNTWGDIYKFMAENMYRLQVNLKEILPIIRENISHIY